MSESIYGEYITLTSVTLPGGGATGFTVANFQDFTFEVLTAPKSNTQTALPVSVVL